MFENHPNNSLFFFDEGRFGCKAIVGRCWTHKRVRPVAIVRPGFENFYVYSAVCPTTGESINLFLPWVNTEMMNIFLKEMETVLVGRQCFLIMDMAGWHKAKDLRVPKSIEIVFLPAFSPELNPVERLWQWMKRHSIRNRFYQNLEDLMDAVQNCLKLATAPFLKNLCSCNYILH